jgi:hypothetical protein
METLDDLINRLNKIKEKGVSGDTKLEILDADAPFSPFYLEDVYVNVNNKVRFLIIR